MKKIVAFLLVAIMMLSIVSCGKDPVTYTPVGKETQNLLSGFYAKSVSLSDIEKSDVKKLYSFYLDLFKNSLDEDGNSSLISPLSIAVVLSMLTDGADGNTLKQLEGAIGISASELDSLLGSYLGALYSGEKCKVHYANSLWISTDERLNVNSRYLQRMVDIYSPGIYAVDFGDSKTVKDINNWVRSHTDDMIKKLVDELSPYTSMVLINALAFDAEWSEKYFDYNVSSGKFTDRNGKTEKVKFMSSQENEYFELDNACGFSKPYAGGKYKFVAFLPNEDVDVFDFVSSLDENSIVKALSSPKKNSIVYAKMPKFSFDYDISLVDSLMNMGICDAFSNELADFSQMATYGDQGGNIYVSEVLHKTHIEVTENGTKAAAVTAAIMTDCSSAPIYENVFYVTLDRPFMYMIVDTENNLPIFMGVLTNVD